MTLIEQVRVRLKDALKTNSPEKDTLRLLISKFQTDNAQTDEQAVTCVRSLVNGNKTAAEKTKKDAAEHNVTPPQEYFDKLDAENKVLSAFLPAYLDGKGIRLLIIQEENVIKQLIDSKNDGMATGIVMKFLKSKNIPAEGETVKQEVSFFRKTIEHLKPLLENEKILTEIIRLSQKEIKEYTS